MYKLKFQFSRHPPGFDRKWILILRRFRGPTVHTSIPNFGKIRQYAAESFKIRP